ncbi:MAG: peptidylprolyl isomerase [Ignavibacterium sp.]
MQKKYLIVGFFSFITMFVFISCSPKNSDIIIAKYDDDKITVSEFEKAYAKNVGSIEKAKQDSISNYKKFLDMYLNFKMKLRDAYVRGYYNNPEMEKELIDYKTKVGITYYIDNKLVLPALKNLYEMRKVEFRVSHIMFRPDSTGFEGAKIRAENVMKKIRNNENFEALAAQYSDDIYSKNIGGDIYYITAGMITPDYDDAVYNTHVGEVYPQIVKTPWGYHIIKVTDKKERIPKIRASHIMIDFKNDQGESDTISAKAKIDSIKMMLNNGEDFAELAKKYSEDSGTAKNGGDLGFFSRRQMVPEFDQTAFNLNVGEVSDIIKTQFGYHIIKVTDRQPYPSFAEEKDELRKLYQNTRYDRDYNKFIDSLKIVHHCSIDSAVVKDIINNSDTTKVGVNYWDSKVQKSFGNSILIAYDKSKISLDSLVKSIENLSDYNGKYLNSTLLNMAIKTVTADLLLAEEAANIDKVDPEFAQLMDDYKNGIYIFKLQEEEVWNKIFVDSAKVYDYWLTVKDNYKFPDKVEFFEIYTKSDSTINHYYELIKNGADFDTIAAKYTERPSFKIKNGKFDLTEVTSSIQARESFKLENSGDYSAPFKNGSGWSMVKLIRKEPARIKTFEEARAEVTGKYQDEESKRLENEYIERLRNIYKPVIIENNLSKLYKSDSGDN